MNIYQLLTLITLTFLQQNIKASEDVPIRYAFQVFQLNGGFTEKTSLKEPIWNDLNSTWKEIESEILLFDEGEFQSGKDRLIMKPDGCFWNDQELTFEEGHQADLPEGKLKMIFSPNLMRKENELVRLKITSPRPYQYMTTEGKGIFKLREVKLPTGLDIEIKAHSPKEDFFYITHFGLDLRSVLGREKVKGTNLPVGAPLLNEQRYDLKLSVREYRSYGILIRPKGSDGIIIIRFEVDDD
ncbi:hypothetical protein OAM01_02585 [bacterium]|nr:hypothetical protein [bacterium]